MSKIRLILNKWAMTRFSNKKRQAIVLIAKTYRISPETLEVMLCKYSLQDEAITRFIENQEVNIVRNFNINERVIL